MKDRQLPGPVPALSDAGFWSACNQHELVFRHCAACGTWHHPPLPLCPRCQSGELEWRPANGPALLYTWTRAHLAMHPSVADVVPYYIAVVEFPSCGGVRLLARLEHTQAHPPPIGVECELLWLVAADGQPIPAFRTLARGL